jgi:imidazole glycerol-phosphate synthase subunit HisF
MALKRVIPVMLVSNRRLVKGKSFSNYKYVGDPLNAIKIFNDKSVDEIIVLDIGASKNRVPDYEFIEKLADESFMPLCYGGGIHTLSCAKQVFNLGIEKISIQSAAINKLSFIQELSEYFGSQSIVLSVDIKKNFFNKNVLYKSAGNKMIKINVDEYIYTAIKMGAGEILLCSVNQEGLMNGPDLDLLKKYSKNINIPLIISGGVGCVDDIYKYINNGADAVAIGAFSVFHGRHRAVLISYPNMDLDYE